MRPARAVHVLKLLEQEAPRVALFVDEVGDQERVQTVPIAARAITWLGPGRGCAVRDLTQAENGDLIPATEAPGRIPGLSSTATLVRVLDECELAPAVLEEGPSISATVGQMISNCTRIWRKCLAQAIVEEEQEQAQRQEEQEVLERVGEQTREQRQPQKPTDPKAA